MSAGVLSVSPFTKDSFMSSRDKSIVTLTDRANQLSYVFADLRPVVCCPLVICVTITPPPGPSVLSGSCWL
jgi:hypothetical protein